MDDTNATDTSATEDGNVPVKPESEDAGEFQAADFQAVGDNVPDGASNGTPNLDIIMDVPVTLSLEVGRTKMSVGHLLRLTQGAVVELDRLAGEPLDVLVNGQLLARGEIVVINDKFGIRLIDVISPTERADLER
ncbi:MAG: flagellar motor switch protein FliN [Gammaproteobacteria bacterium]|nr:flagellar motor switch protein FliN [Gammaproteobacteria bacterium]